MLIVCDELFSCVRFKCNGINLYTSVHLYARLIGDMWYKRRIVLCSCPMRRRLLHVFSTFYCVDSKVKKTNRERTEITVAEIAKLLPNRNECALARLSLSFELFIPKVNTHRNKYAGQNFSNPIACLFSVPSRIPLAFSFACRTLFGCSFSFSSVSIQWNKLLRIVSCNPTIRLFVSLAALPSHRAFAIFQRLRLCRQQMCRSLLAAWFAHRMSKGSQTLFSTLQASSARTQKMLPEDIFLPSWCSQCQWNSHSKCNKITSAHWIRWLLRLIQNRMENYFQMRFSIFPSACSQCIRARIDVRIRRKLKQWWGAADTLEIDNVPHTHTHDVSESRSTYCIW